MQISIKSNIEKVIKDLDNIAKKQIPFAIAKALTDTGKEVATEMEKKTTTIFDRPTRFIQQGFARTMARKGETSIKIFVKDKQKPILHPHVYGGKRSVKRFEEHLRNKGLLPSGMYAVTGSGARLNRYGNMTGGQITQILYGLKAFPDYRSAALTGSGKRTRRRVSNYFVLPPGKHLPPGVWQRKGREIKPILIFTKTPIYQKRYDFHEIGREVVDREFEKKFRAALEYALKTAR